MNAAATAPATHSEPTFPNIHIGVLIQPTFQATAPLKRGFGTTGIGAPSGPEGGGVTPGIAVNPSFDFFLRRARLIASGAITKDLSFFFDTDTPEWGKGGSFAAATIVQDAFLTYTFDPAFRIDAGLFNVPFSHHTVQGAGTLNTLDVHAQTIRFPAGLNFRDAGIEFRGLVADRVHYRIGAFEGVRNSAALETPVEPVGATYPDMNRGGVPRFTGMLRFNILGAERDFAFKGIYFSSTPIVSIGVGGDVEPGAVLKLDRTLGFYNAVSADVFVEYPFSPDDELLFAADGYHYGEGWSRIVHSTALEAGGNTAFAELGYRHAWIEPLVYVEYLKTTPTDSPPITVRVAEIDAYHGGFNFWIDQHTFNIKADVGFRKTKEDVLDSLAGTSYSTVTYRDMLGTIQAQLSF